VALFHIAEHDRWAAATDVYVPEAYERDGFVHLSSHDQVERTARTWYAGRDDVVLLVIDPDALGDAVRWEPGSLGESKLFPHCYGPLPVASVVEIRPLP
jgi:uncharacterized protein (DUF952 family)